MSARHKDQTIQSPEDSDSAARQWDCACLHVLQVVVLRGCGNSESGLATPHTGDCTCRWQY